MGQVLEVIKVPPGRVSFLKQLLHGALLCNISSVGDLSLFVLGESFICPPLGPILVRVLLKNLFATTVWVTCHTDLHAAGLDSIVHCYYNDPVRPRIRAIGSFLGNLKPRSKPIASTVYATDFLPEPDILLPSVFTPIRSFLQELGTKLMEITMTSSLVVFAVYCVELVRFYCL